ncbi:MAG: class I SAM-dependent methyltransferase [Candidatus Cloacimonetes bacterium]|nr:class I SAM-dependent methyltransferase [Candidatus Cloacimonadota bacterium]
MKKPNPSTSWEKSSSWYDKTVGDKGHHYHQNVILPKLLEKMNLGREPGPSVLDLGCGQGILARSIPKASNYTGIDLSPSLIQQAKRNTVGKFREFLVADATKPLPVDQKFTHAVMLLSLQNMEYQQRAIRNLGNCLLPGGEVFLVLNHPCFRIPRQSSWETDPQNSLRYRRINRYKSPMRIPIQTHPGQGEDSPSTWSFHHPIEDYIKWLVAAGCLISDCEEWVSDKSSGSGGKTVKMENMSREEFPLFLFLQAKKIEVHHA